MAGHPTPWVEVGAARESRQYVYHYAQGGAARQLFEGRVIRRATVVAVGKPRGWADEGCEDYLKRLRRYFPVEVAEVAEEDMNRRNRNEVLVFRSCPADKAYPCRVIPRGPGPGTWTDGLL